ncbi:MAG: polysaccharide biosynthesis protein [Oscillospiraceae bacterium]|nr:polysaccharide biosynthesis protein [Oscillospiraceae bacterium]
MNDANIRQKKLLAGVLFLTLSAVVVKVIGLLYKIPLINIIGDDGMGYFNSAYTIYTLFHMIATAGLPVAVSILVAENLAQGKSGKARRILRITMLLFLGIGSVGSAIMFFGSRGLASAIGNSPARHAIALMAPVLFFVCLSSAMRGYFQGRQNMTPTAVSGVIEAGGKLVFGIAFAVWANSRGYHIAVVAAYTILGITISSALGFLYLWAYAVISNRKEGRGAPAGVKGQCCKHFHSGCEHTDDSESNRSILRRLVKIAIPITLSASVLSLTNIIDLAIVMRRLQSIGYSEAMANQLYGNYTGLAVPLFNLPPVLIYPIAFSIVPYISAALSRGDRNTTRNAISNAIKSAAMIGLPASIGLSVLALPILTLLFDDDSAMAAAPLLAILGMAIFFISISAVTTAILQACGKEKLPIISIVAGAVVKLLSSYILIGTPGIGIVGTPIGTLLCYITTAGLNMYFVVRHTKVMPDLRKAFVRPLIAASVCGAAAYLTNRGLIAVMDFRAAVLVAIAVAAVVYVAMLLLLKAVTQQDLALLLGEKRAGKLKLMGE